MVIGVDVEDEVARWVADLEGRVVEGVENRSIAAIPKAECIPPEAANFGTSLAPELFRKKMGSLFPSVIRSSPQWSVQPVGPGLGQPVIAWGLDGALQTCLPGCRSSGPEPNGPQRVYPEGSG